MADEIENLDAAGTDTTTESQTTAAVDGGQDPGVADAPAGGEGEGAKPMTMRDAALRVAERMATAGAGAGGPPAKPGDPQASSLKPQASAQEVDQLLSTFGFSGVNYSPEDRALLGGKLTEFRDWATQVDQYAQQAEQRATQAEAQTNDVLARVERIAGNPQFVAALRMVQGAGAPGANGKPPAFETETEERLWQETQALRQTLAAQHEQFQAMQERMGQLDAGFGAMTQQQEQTALRETNGQIRALHQELDKQFPELASDRKLRKDWHAKAAELLRIAGSTGQPVDLRQALVDAGKLLHYDFASKRGATTALQAAKTAARSSTLRETQTRAAAPPREGETIRDVGRRLLANFPGLQ